MLIDWFTVAAQAVNFLILVWLLKRFLYKPVLAAIDEREKRIAAQLHDAETKKAEALQEQADFARKNEEFEQHRAALLLDATNTANAERETLMETARKDSEELRSKLQQMVYGELDNLNRKLETLAQQEVFFIARKTLADLAGVSLEERLTNVFIQRLYDLNEAQRTEFKASFQASSRRVLVRSAFELAPPLKTAIADAAKPLLGEGVGIDFETRPDLISGIELSVNGRKIAWSIADYLASLSHAASALLEPKSAATSSKEAVPHAT